MAVYNKQRLFWIKLTDRFMTSDTVDFLMEQKDGANYVLIYQMLCLKTVNNDGCLARKLGEVIVPYDEIKIARDLKWFSIDTIRVALELYKKLGLVYEQSDGILKISNFENLIGSQTVSAEKRQEQRERQSLEASNKCSLPEGDKKATNVALEGGQKVDNCPPDKDKDKDKDYNRTNEHIKSFYNKSIARVDYDINKRASYDDVMNDCELEKEVRPMMSQFIKHCTLNGHKLTDEKLANICLTMDFQQLDVAGKISALQTAINGGYYDIRR